MGQNVIDFDTNIDGLSFSAGINYRFNENHAVYVRYARGQKAPDLRFYSTYTTEFAVDNVPPKNQVITQIEAAYKLRSNKISATITPFLSQLDDVTVITVVGDENNQLYFPEPQLNSIETYGVEIELDWNITDYLSINGSATFQDSEYTNWRVWDVGDAVRTDDVLVDYTGNEAENTPNIMLNITPTLQLDKFYALLQFRYMGVRQANQPNAYEIPGFSTLNLGLGYDFTKNLSASFNINNLTNTFGVMSSFAPGPILQVFNPQTVTSAVIEADPNAIHPVVAIQPRSYFLSLSYRF